jgi:ubiquinone/menaquinone biosynthesis C-methylase UbiE
VNQVEYLEDIPWFQELPADIADLEEAQRFAFRKNQLVMTRHGMSPWAFLLSGEVHWLRFDPETGKVKPFARTAPGQFLGLEDLPSGSIAVAASDGELLLIPRSSGQSDPFGRPRAVAGRQKVPANDIPFHAYHMDRAAPLRTAIDIGAGVGHFSQLMAGYCDRVTAVDPMSAVTDLALVRMRALGYGNFSAVQATAEELPFEANSVDLVGCRLATHQFQDPAAFAAETRRVLRVGGLVALTDIVAPADPRAAQLLNRIERTRDPTHGCVVTKESMLNHYVSGFEVVATLDTVLKIPLMQWLRQAGTDEDLIADLLREMSASGELARQLLGLTGDIRSTRSYFNSPRFSVILQRTK